MKEYFKQTAVRNNLRDIWRFIKLAMVTAIVTNYFNILYGGYLWVFFCVLSGMFFAMGSIVDNEANFRKSIFRNLNPKFFCKELSWDNKNKIHWLIPDGLSDFWHIAIGAAWLCSFIALGLNKYDIWYETAAVGLYYHWTSFSLFYDIILRRK